jgi:hypothetical protein
MNEHYATEIAFKNGYEKAARDIINEIRSSSSYSVASIDGMEIYSTKSYQIAATTLDELEKKYTGENSQ